MSRPRMLAPWTAGAAAVLVVHQPLLAGLHAAGWAPWPAFSWTPTHPLGLPAVLSAAFWGGVWAVPLDAALRGARTPNARRVRAAAFGAVLPNAVGAALIAAGHGAAPRGASPARTLAAAVVINAAWALGAAALLRKHDDPA